MRERAPNIVVNKFNHPLDEIKQPGRGFGGCPACGLMKSPQEENAERNRPEHRIHINRPEPHCLGFAGGVSQSPTVISGQLTKSQVLQMVVDITRCSKRVTRHFFLGLIPLSTPVASFPGSRTSWIPPCSTASRSPSRLPSAHLSAKKQRHRARR